MDKNPIVEVKRTCPPLLIERVVLYETLDPVTPIREVCLRRGLNVVWGIPDESPSSGDTAAALTGHSVGKTSFCRLVRYCLGEDGFGRRAAVAGIQQSFPNGFVGAVVRLAGEQWSVLRPFGNTGKARAGNGIALDTLAAGLEGVDYVSFRRAVDQAFLEPLPSSRPPASDKEYEWSHVLGWLARDQEARFQSLWQWRSSRANSRMPGFRRPREDAVYLIRMVLGFLDAEEVQITRRLDARRQELSDHQARIAQLRQSLEWARDYQMTRAAGLLGSSFHADGEQDGLWNLNSQIGAKLDELNLGMAELSEKEQALDGHVAACDAWIMRWEQDEQRRRAAQETTSEGTEPLAGADDSLLQQLQEAYYEICVFGNIRFRECEHFRDHLSEAQRQVIDFERARQDARAQDAAVDRRVASQEVAGHRAEIERLVTALREERRRTAAQRAELRRNIAKLRAEIADLARLRDEHRQTMDLMEGRIPNTEMESITSEEKSAKEDIQQSERNLAVVLGRHYMLVQELQSLYDRLLKRVLSPTYTGAVDFRNGELDFRIGEATGGLAGEAVETLALVLADVAALLWGAAGHGLHPGLLIHDSPREADLHHDAYNGFLRALHSISQELGGAEAPFQYIVTTTTRPPDALLAGDTVCLRLHAHPPGELLFRRRLNTMPLFGDDGEEGDT